MNQNLQFLNRRAPSRFDILSLASVGPLTILGGCLGNKLLDQLELSGHLTIGLILFGVCFLSGFMPPLIRLIRLRETLEFPFNTIAVSGFFILLIANGAFIIITSPWVVRMFSSGYTHATIYALVLFVSSLVFYLLAFRHARRAPYNTARLIAWLHVGLTLPLMVFALFRLFAR